MDVWVRFIGLILFYQAHAGAPYQILIPKWENDNICEVAIIPHAPFIRIASGRDDVVEEKTKWEERTPCNTKENCTLFQIPNGYTLSIDTGFKALTKPPSQPLCLIPDFAREALVATPRLHPEAFTTRSAVDMTLPNGTLSISHFGPPVIKPDPITHKVICPAMFVALRVPSDPSSETIKITATPRRGVTGTPHVLVVKAGTVINILNEPPDFAKGDDNIVSDDDNLKHHFHFLRKLLDVPDNDVSEANCKDIPKSAPKGNCAGPRLRCPITVTTTHNTGCGPGGLIAGGGGGR